MGGIALLQGWGERKLSMRHGWLWISIVWVGAALPACGESGRGSPAKPEAAASAPAVAAAAEANPGAAATEASLPADIAAFRERRDACDHFRGEDAYDAKRAAFLAAEVTKACAGTDRALADLRERYAGNAGALAALKDYEDKIE